MDLFIRLSETIFISSKCSKISTLHRLLLNFWAKIGLKNLFYWSDKFVALSNRIICYTWKNIEALKALKVN